ncbi:MAG: molybdopterin-dependent oxidoreductase, partial [Actinomycetota bacterium]
MHERIPGFPVIDWEGADALADDCFRTASSSLAHVILPAAMFGEVDGTFCNMEGRLSPIRAKVTAPGLARPDWMIAAELASVIGPDLGFDSLEQLRGEMHERIPGFPVIDWEGADALADGPLVRLDRNWDLEFGDAASAPSPTSNGLRLVVDRKLWDQGTMVQRSPSLSGLAQSAELRLSATDVQMLGLADSQWVTVEHGDNSYDLPFSIDPGVAPRTAWVPVGLPGFDVRQMLATGRSVTTVGIRAAEEGN